MGLMVAMGSLMWLALILLPWRPWSTRERLEPDEPRDGTDLSDVTALIPARNEELVIERTLGALRRDGNGLRVTLVDDQSSDGTASIARSTLPTRLKIVPGEPLREGWTGKLWALEQGWRGVDTHFVLLLDADIEIEPGMLETIKRKLIDENLALVSIMAQLRMESFWEKLLVPAFVYFFKLIYPFAVGNDPRSNLGVAAGGCILLRSDSVRMIGGFHALRNAIIDDCSLARLIKKSGNRTWIGLSHSVRSHRPYERLSNFWEMVERTAFAQLQYSNWLLLATTLIMLLGFWLTLGRFILSSSPTQNGCRGRGFGDDIVLSADPALLSQINGLGSNAPVDQQPLPPHDVVVRPTLLARAAVRMERSRLRKGVIRGVG